MATAVRSAKRATPAEHLQSTLKTAEAQARGQVTRRPEAKKPHWECRCGERNWPDERNCSRCSTPRGAGVLRFLDAELQLHEPPIDAKWRIAFADFTGERLAGVIVSQPETAPLPAKPEAKGEEFAQIEISKIQPSPTNPRKTFGAEGLEKLAKSIKSVGIIQPLIVRTRFAGNFELVAGERRYRGAVLAELTHAPCMIRELTDEQVIEIQLLENLDREDLNPIDEALTFERLLALPPDPAGQKPWTQEKLAARLNYGQSYVAHRLRLLELPEAWRERVMSQDIPVSHAKALVAWSQFPAILKAIEKALKRDDELPTVKEFERLVLRAVHDGSRSMELRDYWGPKFDRTTEIDAKLQLLEVPNQWESGHTQRAFNCKLWDKLQNAAKSRAAAAEKAKASAPKAVKSTGPQKPHEPTDLQFGRLIWTWRTRWLCGRLQELCRKKQIDTLVRLMLLLKEFGSDRTCDFGTLLGLKGACPKLSQACPALVAAKGGAAFSEFLASYVCQELDQDPDCDSAEDPFCQSEELPIVASSFGVGLESWRPTAEYLELYSDKRLRALAKSPALAKVLGDYPAGAARDYRIELLIRDWPPGHVPAELRTVNEYGKFEPEAAAKPAGKAAKKG